MSTIIEQLSVLLVHVSHITSFKRMFCVDVRLVVAHHLLDSVPPLPGSLRRHKARSYNDSSTARSSSILIIIYSI